MQDKPGTDTRSPQERAKVHSIIDKYNAELNHRVEHNLLPAPDASVSVDAGTGTRANRHDSMASDETFLKEQE